MPMDHKMRITTPSDREIAMSRVFDAPRQLVFEAYTRPELLKRWLGVHNGWTLAVCEIDLRVGGAYRYVWRGPGREEMGMRGVYREIVVPERVVASEVFDQAWYEGDAESSLTLVEHGGQTTLTLTARYASRQVRDAVLRSPMESGVAAGFDKLAELLASPGAGIDVPRVLETTAQLTAKIHLTIAKDAIRTAMGPGISELMETVKAQGVGPTGPWFTHHLRIEPSGWDFEICVPVSAPVTPAGRVVPGSWPAMRVARTVYRGPYEGLHAAWPALDAWVAANGHTPAADLWECYVAGPESGADPSSWRTELTRPLIG